MSKLSYMLSLIAIVAASNCVAAVNDAGETWTPRSELSSKIAEIKVDPNKKVNANSNFVQVPNVAQYKNADWSKAVGIARGISEEDALQIAKSNPKISYFFRTKGFQMILETSSGDYRRLGYGDTVFFTGTPQWGTAPNLADGYVKQ